MPALSRAFGKPTWDFTRWITIDDGHDLPLAPSGRQRIAEAAAGPVFDAPQPPPVGTVLTLQWTLPFEGRLLPTSFTSAARAIEGDPKHFTEGERLGIRRILATFDHRRDAHALLLAYGLMLQARATAGPHLGKQIMFVDSSRPTEWEPANLAKRQSPDIWLGMWLVMGIILFDGVHSPDLGGVDIQAWIKRRANTRIRSLAFVKVGLGKLSTTASTGLRFDLSPGAWIPAPATDLSTRWKALKGSWKSKNYERAFAMVYDDPSDIESLSSIARGTTL